MSLASSSHCTHSDPSEPKLEFEITFSVLKGASMVKWTALDPRSCLSGSDPKLYTNFKFYEIEIHKHLENI